MSETKLSERMKGSTLVGYLAEIRALEEAKEAAESARERLELAITDCYCETADGGGEDSSLEELKAISTAFVRFAPVAVSERAPTEEDVDENGNVDMWDGKRWEPMDIDGKWTVPPTDPDDPDYWWRRIDNTEPVLSDLGESGLRI